VALAINSDSRRGLVMKHEMDLNEFKEQYGLELVVIELGDNEWKVSFANVALRKGTSLRSAFGVGKTKKEAIQNFARCISGKTIENTTRAKNKRESALKSEVINVPQLVVSVPEDVSPCCFAAWEEITPTHTISACSECGQSMAACEVTQIREELKKIKSIWKRHKRNATALHLAFSKLFK